MVESRETKNENQYRKLRALLNRNSKEDNHSEQKRGKKEMNTMKEKTETINISIIGVSEVESPKTLNRKKY